MARKDNSKLRELIKEYGVKDMKDVHEFVKMLTAETIQAALDAELESELGYSKYDTRNKKTDDSRNGYSAKTVQGSMGEVEIDVPRDRKGEYEPELVRKHQTDISAIEDKIIFLYSQGVSTREIEKTMQEMYGIEVDDSRVSKITDKILPVIREWQERPLQGVYAMLVLDAIHYNRCGYEKGGVCGDRYGSGREKGRTGDLAWSGGIIEVLAIGSERTQEPGSQGHIDRVGGRTAGLCGSHQRGFPEDGNPKVHCSPDPEFDAVRFLERPQGIHAGSEADIQGGDGRVGA